MADDQVVHKIARRDGEELRATLNQYQGRLFAHLRVYYEASDGWRPTKAGIAIPVDRLHELEEAVAALRKAVNGGRQPRAENGGARRRRATAGAAR